MLEELADGPRAVGRVRAKSPLSTREYVWERDCPIDLQSKLETKTEFKLEFELNEADQNEFYSDIGSSINDHLPITIKVGRDLIPNFEVNKPGKGYAALTKKSSKIAEFIGGKLSINYIPAVRTARESANSVERLVSSALRKVERTEEFENAMATIDQLQRPVLAELEEKLLSSLSTFIPAVKDVSLEISLGRRSMMRAVRIGIDDGRLTPLENKGDGVISLVGMALLSKVDSLTSEGVNLVLVIEEPESHLHPRAIHSIRNILDTLGGDVQVMITTHSPSLVNRLNVGSNILVEGSKARVAKSVSEIRDVLGVRVADNLTNSRLSIICEGDNDQRSLEKLLRDIEPELGPHFDAGEISFSSLGGGGNLSYSVSSIQNSICEPVCILDDDVAGHAAFKTAQEDSLLDESDVVFTKRMGKPESEFEDLICGEIVEKYLQAKFKANFSNLPSGIRKKKFSTRAKTALEAAGRPWSENTKSKIKYDLNEICAQRGLAVIDPNLTGPLVSLAQLVLERLEAQ